MFERFTDRARQALFFAQEEARLRHDEEIRPEHLLLALTRGEGLAAQAMSQSGVDPDAVRGRLGGTAAHQSPAGAPTPVKLPFTPRAKKALELSLREALRLGHNYIGTEHLLLAVLRLGEEDATEWLGVPAEAVRSTLMRLVGACAAGDLRSPAAAQAERRARALAATGPVTTGHLLKAVLADHASQASLALQALGLDESSIGDALASTPVAGTSDEPPKPRSVEIKLGDATTTIDDSDLADALAALSPDELRDALQRAFGRRRRRRSSAAG